MSICISFCILCWYWTSGCHFYLLIILLLNFKHVIIKYYRILTSHYYLQFSIKNKNFSSPLIHVQNKTSFLSILSRWILLGCWLLFHNRNLLRIWFWILFFWLTFYMKIIQLLYQAVLLTQSLSVSYVNVRPSTSESNRSCSWPNLVSQQDTCIKSRLTLLLTNKIDWNSLSTKLNSPVCCKS